MSPKNLIIVGSTVILSLGVSFMFFSSRPTTTKQKPEPIEDIKDKTPQKEKFIFIALGDSLTAGYNLNKEDTFPHLLEQKLNKEFPQYQTQVINAGINGSTTSSALSRLKTYLSFKPNIVLIALGSNDGMRGTSIDTIQKNLEETIQLAKTNNIKIILVGLKLPLNYGDDYRIPFEKVFTNLAQKHKIAYVPFLLEGVATIPEYNLPDGIHPNEKGHRIITNTLYPYFKSFYP